MTLIIADNKNKVLYADYVGLINGYDKVTHNTKIISYKDFLERTLVLGFSGAGRTSTEFSAKLFEGSQDSSKLTRQYIRKLWLELTTKQDASGLGFLCQDLIMLDSDGEYIELDEKTKFAAIGCGAPYALSLLEYMHEQTGKVDIAKVFQIVNKFTVVGAEYEEIKI